MKLCSVVLFAVLVAVVCADHGKHHHGRGPFKEMFKECMEKGEVDKETMKDSRGKADPDSKVKCVYSCVCEKLGVMEPDGSPNQAGADEMIAKLPEKMKNLKDNIIECMKVMKPGLEKCESGWLAVKCMKDKMPHHKGHKKDRKGSDEDE